MNETPSGNVSSAFDLLLEEIEAVIDELTAAGARAFAARDLEKAREILERSNALTRFRSKVADLRNEWRQLDGRHPEKEPSGLGRRDLGRLQKGRRTPEDQFYPTILEVLVRMGGRGRVSEVLDRVGALMKSSLKPVDFEPVPSDPTQPRWRNTAQWARKEMVEKGWLRADSPRGVWEISGKGREVLKQMRMK